MPNKNFYQENKQRKKSNKNFFKILKIKKGEALVVINDDIIFSFPVCLLPKEAKLGDTFSLEIKLFNNEIKQKELEEIGLIQKKYSEKIIDKNQESK